MSKQNNGPGRDVGCNKVQNNINQAAQNATQEKSNREKSLNIHCRRSWICRETSFRIREAGFAQKSMMRLSGDQLV